MENEAKLSEIAMKTAASEPLIFSLRSAEDRARLAGLIEAGEVRHAIDDYEEQLRELYQIDKPSLVYRPDFESLFQKELERHTRAENGFVREGNWVFFPWNNTAVHLLEDADFQRVRTARNRNLISEEEQKRYREAVVGVCGLSVGNSVALSIVLQGGASRIRLADFDRLALSNLNRIRSGVDSLGIRKVEMTARQIYALNPYAKVELFPDGITQENIARFFDGEPRLDLVIDEIDNLSIKYLIRKAASERRIPLLMGADNGDNAVIDVERYDMEPQPPFFNGRLGEVTFESLAGLDKFGIGRTITKHIGPENITGRMQESLLAMGKSIVSWPQLGGAALINGAAIAYAARKILTNQPLIGDRALISLDEKMIPDYGSTEASAKRDDASRKFADLFKL